MVDTTHADEPTTEEIVEGLQKPDESIEKQLEQELKIAQAMSLASVNEHMSGLIPRNHADNILDGRSVEDSMESVSVAVQAALEGVSTKMQGVSNALTREGWRIGGTDIAHQITTLDINGLNSVEIGTTSLDVLEASEDRLTKENELLQARNKRFMDQREVVDPFLEASEITKSKGWKRFFVGTGLASGATVSTIGLATGVGAISLLPGSLIAGGTYLAFAAVRKYVASQREKAKEAEAKKQAHYKKFNEDFLTQLNQRFTEYKMAANLIKEAGEAGRDALLVNIEQSIDMAEDEDRAAMGESLMKLKNQTNILDADINTAASRFPMIAPRTPLSESMKINFLEAVKKVEWIDNMLKVKRELNKREAIDESFMESTQAQEAEFTTQLSGVDALNDYLTNYKSVKEMEVVGIKPFALLEPDAESPSEDELLRDIRRDLAREGFLSDLSDKFTADMTDMAGLAESTDLIFTLHHLFCEHDEFLVDGTIAIPTLQKILTWIYHKDIETRRGVPEVSDLTVELVDDLEDSSSGLFAKGNLILEALDMLELDDLDKHSMSDYETSKDDGKIFVIQIEKIHTKFKKGKNDLPENDQNEFETTFEKFKKHAEYLRDITHEAWKKKKDFDVWKSENIDDPDSEYNTKNSDISRLDDEIAALEGADPRDEDEIARKTSERELLIEFVKTVEDSRPTFNRNSYKRDEKRAAEEFFGGSFEIESKLHSVEGYARDTLYRRIKGSLFEKFEKEMKQKMLDHWEKNDPYKILLALNKKAGKVTVGYLKDIESIRQVSLPSHLDQKKTTEMVLTKNSRDGELEMQSTDGTLLLHLVKPMIHVEKVKRGKNTDILKSLVHNAIIFDRATDGSLSNARETVVTNVEFTS